MASEPRSRNRTRTPAPSAPAIAPGANAEGPKLSDVASGANKTFGNGMVVSATAFHQNANCIPLGHLVGDLAMLGGIPEGQSAMFIGNEGGGKTTQAMRCVAAAQRKYPEHTALWVDTEQTFDPTWAEHHGVDLSRLHIAQPVAGEDAVDLLKTACEQAADLCFAVLDSVNQTIPMKEYEESVADIQVALHPRLMGRMSSRMTTSGSVRRQNRWVPVTKIFINQWRYKIGGLVLGDPRTIPGGRQFIHHCSTHLEFKSKLKTAKDDDDMETTSLVEHTINVRRAKIASSIRSGEYQVVVGPDHRLPIGSFDEAGTIVAFAKRIELYTGGGTNQGFNGIGPRFRNMDAAKEWLEANPDQALEIKRMIIMHRREKVGLPPVPPDGFLLRW